MTTEWFDRNGAPYDGFRSCLAIIDEHRASYTRDKACNRCGGAGGSDKWAHTGWTCFDCGGSGKGGVETVKLYSAEKLAKLDATAAKRHAKKAKAAAEAHAAKQASHRAVFDAWWASDGPSAFADRVRQHQSIMTDSEREFCGQYFASIDDKRVPSLGLTDAVAAIVDRAIARKAEREACDYLGQPGDRVTFTGKVREIYYRPSERYGWPPYYIFSITGAGFCAIYKGGKSWEDGAEVTLTATVKELTEYQGMRQTVIARPKST